MKTNMDTLSLGNRLLVELGLSSTGPQGEPLSGWSISVVDDSPHFEENSPGCARFKTSTIYLRRSALNGGEQRGVKYCGEEVAVHEVAHALTGSPDHDAIFDAALRTVELASHVIRYSPASVELAADGGNAEDPEQMLRERLQALPQENFKVLTHASLRKVLAKMDADQYSEIIWSPSGLHFRALLDAAGITDADVPGGRLTPPYHTKVDDDGE
jgi:hypothetical protein